ncbi:MAG: 3-isopropylmalate dehydratase large subunit [Bacteroidales bacterium]
MKQKTLFDKIWDTHVVHSVKGGPDVLYIDMHYIHEVTSPQAFNGLRERGVGVFRPGKTLATADHNIPTKDQNLPIKNEVSRKQVSMLEENCRTSGIEFFGMQHPNNGIVHIIGPELGYTRPGMTIVCGDSHTSTHGAFGAVAFGIGTSEVETVLATQCILQNKPGQMRIKVNGTTRKAVSAKDIILFIISQLSSSGATGYFIEYAGETIEKLSMEGRMTICNMSIEMGARGGLIAPDNTTFAYLDNIEKRGGKKISPQERTLWKDLKTDNGAQFDREAEFDATLIRPMITFGTNPGMAIPVDGTIPEPADNENIDSYLKSLEYMGFQPGMKLEGQKIDYVFAGSCTNGRIEDFRAFASVIKGKKKSPDVTALIVPGSKKVETQIINEGLDKIFREAGFEIRQPGCSSCLAMNDDKIPAGKYVVSTSNRNFEGRQGPGSRTILASPLTAAACAITGKITSPEEYI